MLAYKRSCFLCWFKLLPESIKAVLKPLDTNWSPQKTNIIKHKKEE